MYYKYEIEKEQVSYDSGQTWADTYATRVSSYSVGTYATLSECEGSIPPTPSYDTQYFTIESLEDNNEISLVGSGNGSQHGVIKVISASTDNGATWTEYTFSTSTSPATTVITLDAGEKAIFKGLNSSYYYEESFLSNANSYRPSCTKRYKAYGNMMSLVSGDSFTNATILSGRYAFAYFFCGDTMLMDASNLILPATTLTYRCYFSMFRGASITTAPALPATTLVERCYEFMFYHCTSLTTVPVLPATTLATRCYALMFDGCSALNYIKCLATDISATDCTGNWVRDVASSGTFVKASSMTGWSSGTSGIPDNWTIQNA